MNLRGFSIIELLLVLLVSGIISSVVAPNYSKIQELAKNYSLKNQSYAIQLALQSYELELGQFPSSDSGIEGLLSELTTKGYIQSSAENPYTKTTFSNDDSSGLIEYNYDASTQRYSLAVYGYLNETLILELGH